MSLFERKTLSWQGKARSPITVLPCLVPAIGLGAGPAQTTARATELAGKPRGFTGRTSYDLLNRIVQVADPLGHAIRFEYDPNSNVTKVIDPRGNETTYAYTPMDYLHTRTTDPAGSVEIFTYDLGGNITSYQDRKKQRVTPDPYDDLNRPTTVRFRNSADVELATLTYGYDAANRLQSLADSAAGPITWGYDPLDRLTTETTPQGTVTYVLDDANRPESTTVAGQGPVTYTFDNANRLQTIAKDSLSASYGYDIANRLTSLTLPNGITLTYGYDDADRVTSVVYALGATELGRLTYAYNPNGQQTSMGGAWARTVLPNALSSASYDAANRQTALGSKSMTYDNNGNLATLTESGQSTTFTWDPRDRLTNVAGQGLSASFSYDATGRRTSKTVAGFETTFQYDGADIIKETSGGAEVFYLRGLGMDQPIARIDSSGTATCYVPGALGSTWALTHGTTGDILTSYTYGPFGQTTTSGNPDGNAFQYTGRENDGTGLYYYRARYYHPGLSRFISEDPIGFAGGDANLYAYVGNDPINAVDPSGLFEPGWRGPFPEYYAFPVGAPRWWEHLIPLWGCGRAMINDFQCGNYWGAALNAGCLALEATALGAAATKAWKWGKRGWKAWREAQRAKKAGQALSEIAQQNVRALRNWARSQGWERQPGAGPEVWGVRTPGGRIRMEAKGQAARKHAAGTPARQSGSTF